MAFQWTSRCICMNAPATAQVDRFCRFIRDVFAKDGIDTLVLLVRYRFQFESYPLCRANDPLSKEDAEKIAEVCKACGIRLIPKMNLFGHQSDRGGKNVSGLLAEHPEFDENKGGPVEYCRTLCASEPEALKIVLTLADEMIDAFGADGFHIGCDEVFEIGKCEKCKDTPTAILYANWVNSIVDHLQERGVEVWMWGDRLLSAAETGYGLWESSENGTEGALALLRKGVVIGDWHYGDCDEYKSPKIFAEAGFKVYLCTYCSRRASRHFLEYAAAHDQGNILGPMAATWISAGAFMDCWEGKLPTSGNTDTIEGVVDNYRYLFEEN